MMSFFFSEVIDQLYLNMLQLQLQHKVQLHSTFMKSVKGSWKIYNCSTMRGYVCIFQVQAFRSALDFILAASCI